MTYADVWNEYFKWLLDLVDVTPDIYERYSELFNYLMYKKYEWTHSLDCHRATDGVDLRSSFFRDLGLSHKGEPCSVLEMMVALSHRCEKSIMCNPDKGDRTGIWFWSMLESLGIDNMDNDIFETSECEEILQNLFSNKYSSDGKGGLFYVEGYEKDMRDLDIWYQMCAYLESYYPLL